MTKIDWAISKRWNLFTVIKSSKKNGLLRTKKDVIFSLRRIIKENAHGLWSVTNINKKFHPKKILKIKKKKYLEPYMKEGKKIIARQQLDKIFIRNHISVWQVFICSWLEVFPKRHRANTWPQLHLRVFAQLATKWPSRAQLGPIICLSCIVFRKESVFGTPRAWFLQIWPGNSQLKVVTESWPDHFFANAFTRVPNANKWETATWSLQQVPLNPTWGTGGPLHHTS